jgi:acyl-CoA thioesterase YciA
VATVAVNAMRFIQPVLIGDLISIYCRVDRVGHTSIRVDVEVFAERDRDFNQLHAVATGTLTYVAVGKDRRPRPVLAPDSESAE